MHLHYTAYGVRIAVICARTLHKGRSARRPVDATACHFNRSGPRPACRRILFATRASYSRKHSSEQNGRLIVTIAIFLIAAAVVVCACLFIMRIRSHD
jgi:hypothetical protein